MQDYQYTENTGPAMMSGEELIRLTAAEEPLKRVADESAPALRRKAAKTNFSRWICATCSADNSDLLNHRCSACGTGKVHQRAEKRDSITSLSTGSCSLNSLTIDELINNLEGLEFDVNMDTFNAEQQTSRLGFNDSMNESATSRFSAGNWSLKDLEKWSCSMCTYENEPLFCVCDMCGHTRASFKPSLHLREALPSVSVVLAEDARTKAKATSIVAQQKERLSELLEFRKPAATGVKLPTLPGTQTVAPKQLANPKPPRHENKQSISQKALSSATPRGVVPSKVSVGNIVDVQKPPRAFNPEDSGATATTFDMSASTVDHWFPEQMMYPGIEEEDGVEC